MSQEQIKRNEEQRIRLEKLLKACHSIMAKPGATSNETATVLSTLVNTELALAINGAVDKLYDIKEELFHIQLGIRESSK